MRPIVEDARHQRRPLNELFRARLTRFLIGGERLFETRLRTRQRARIGAYRKNRISGWLAGPVQVWWNVTKKTSASPIATGSNLRAPQLVCTWHHLLCHAAHDLLAQSSKIKRPPACILSVVPPGRTRTNTSVRKPDFETGYTTCTKR